MTVEEYKALSKWKGKIFMKDEETCFNDGFAEGRKENCIVWHDLRKDPNDLPKDEKKVLLQIVDEENPIMDFYNHKFKMWKYTRQNEAIAWAEIPKFKEN